MAASVSVPERKSEVKRIFENMEYGPAPEASNVAKAWLQQHDNALGHFIGGKWVKPENRKTYDTCSPATGEVLASTTQGEEEDVNNAVSCAKEAFKSWSQLPPHSRARYLYAIARNVQKHHRLIAVMEALDNGKSIRETRDCDIPLVARHFYHHAGWAQLSDTEMRGWKPIGVVGAIVPWNFPLMLLTWKVCPALAMGNTVVLKPATFTRLSALLFAEICHEAGLPPGVFNVVTGNGAFGSKLAMHPDVDKVAFTGSTPVGQTLRRLTAGTGKKLSLELGGKSPVIVMENADLDSTVEGIVDAIYFNQGQVCSAGSKLIVQENIYDDLIARLKERMSHFRLGHSLDKGIDVGAVVSKQQLATITEFVEEAKVEGAEVFHAPVPVPQTGLFYPPTLITKVQTVSRVVREEIFGPVLVALPFRTAKEAQSIGNNTNYGLAASVWSDHLPTALELAISIKAGSVWVNCHNLFDAAAGFGGYRESGFGRDGGKEGLFEYVRPAWEERPRPECKEIDVKSFGSTFGGSIMPAPGQGQPTANDVQQNGIRLPKVDHTYKVYYGGAQKRPDGCYSRPIYAINKQIAAYVGDSNRKDVRNAVEAAHKAAPGWGKRAAHNRAQIVYYMAENLEMRRSEVANRLTQLTGESLESSMREVDLSIQRLFYWGAYADKFGGSVQETQLYGCTVCIREPVGVIGIACPDQNPLLAFVSLFAPAVIRANCVVIIPSERHPIPALDFYQVFDTSDLPGGVVNILSGGRDHVTKYLVEHQNVEAMWYFGSAEGSKFVEHSSAENVKRTWVNYGIQRDWSDPDQGQGEEFLYHATQCKNIWMPMGVTYAN
uniref:Aldehyde dehydrogenase family 16 member A1-like n=1 Tax=Phallusia mammillata TaxID=59560 RepID=A0A6F9D5G5_9ASCI|nr:aldehyde dehydrogenase family 16 member A1-like [Phallusia mammillata]